MILKFDFQRDEVSFSLFLSHPSALSCITTVYHGLNVCPVQELFQNKKLLFNTFVAHGRNTGEEYAKSFSNDEGSYKSSLGFYITEHPIIGSHTGFALLIDGVEKGFNDHAVRRAIIIHAAEYVTENFIKKYGRLGRSYGCPSLPPEMNKPIIDVIKGGTCLFLYNPNKEYLSNSALLN